MRTGLTPVPLTNDGSPAQRLAERQRLRQTGIARRLALSDETLAALSASICTHLGERFPQLASMRVAFCWPIRNEPDLRPLMRTWLAAGQTGFSALLPVVVDDREALAFRAWTPESAMTADRYGIPTPTTGEFTHPQALLIPVNAFDSHGYRLGYGGGFFDRTLASLQPAPLAIGVGFELARVESILPEAHDIRLDAIVTETGVWLPGNESGQTPD